MQMRFDAFFSSKGGICRDMFSEIPLIQSYLLYARAEIDVLRKGEHNIPPIYVDLINNPALNATAARSGNQYFIGIYIGAILQSFAVFSRMMASNTILTDIGSAALEDPPQKMHDIQLKETIHPLLSFTRELVPKDPIRNEVVKMFVKHVLDFLIFHEYAHIVYGHVDYRNSKQQSVFADNVVLQALETSADGFSTFISMMLLYKALSDENPIIPKALRSHYKDRYTALRMWLFPIYTYFRLFGHMNLQYCTITESHPSPGYRVNLIVEAIDTFKELGFANDDQLLEHCIDILIEVEEAFAQISEQGLDIRPLHTSLSEEPQKCTNDLFAKEIEIFDLLKEYSYIH